MRIVVVVVVFLNSSYIRVFGPFQTEADAKHGCYCIIVYLQHTLCPSHETHRTVCREKTR